MSKLEAVAKSNHYVRICQLADGIGSAFGDGIQLEPCYRAVDSKNCSLLLDIEKRFSMLRYCPLSTPKS